MDWKETVVTTEATKKKRKELFPHGHKDCVECEQFIREAQAEVSFKAGMREALDWHEGGYIIDAFHHWKPTESWVNCVARRYEEKLLEWGIE